MVWKRIKIFTADREQYASIEPNPEQDGICLQSGEVLEDRRFTLYMTLEEAGVLGNELIKYADGMKVFNK